MEIWLLSPRDLARLLDLTPGWPYLVLSVLIEQWYSSEMLRTVTVTRFNYHNVQHCSMFESTKSERKASAKKIYSGCTMWFRQKRYFSIFDEKLSLLLRWGDGWFKILAFIWRKLWENSIYERSPGYWLLKVVLFCHLLICLEEM